MRTSSLKSFFKTLKVKEVYRRKLNTIPMFLVSSLSAIFITFFQVFRQERGFLLAKSMIFLIEKNLTSLPTTSLCCDP
ncbi:hypothetical protein LEP1GSC125_1458 [Leptospira mayottensis 200901122]|uniref:Uncharacterized protein n=2 Tax=Leptospira mayottensis TaxID=1137606 RepID=A0AA87SX93_9LEPT|nr:hypothetical protein DQM28_00565 [Leptospira mayottensis]EKS00710.1 hypothetical protein LEP1GSC125_1458 [Leptospira mayottensis 200901122]